LTGYVDVKFDENKAIFFDRNAKYFSIILDYLRKADIENDFELSLDINLQELEKEATFYNLKGLLHIISNKMDSWKKASIIMDSIILNDRQKRELISLCQFQTTAQFNLLYRASRDGFNANTFHLNCDNKPKTLTVIKLLVDILSKLGINLVVKKLTIMHLYSA